MTDFHPCCVFLLDWQYVNLFEPVGRTWAAYRCKGCGEVVGAEERESHHAAHRADLAAARERSRVEAGRRLSAVNAARRGVAA